MPHAYLSNLVHCVFSTKDRRSIIPTDLESKLHAYIFGISKNLGIELVAVGGTGNHLHVLIALPSKMPLSEVIQKIKCNSSRWIGEHGCSFVWQVGYGAFSVSPSHVQKVRLYIRNQAEHHQKRSFEEEFTDVLQKAGIHFDPNTVFESVPSCRTPQAN